MTHASGNEIYVLLHNIRSVHNVGAIFRTADAAGVHEIFITGYTPTPLDRFGREVKELSKVALGGELSVKWSAEPDPRALLARLKKDGVSVVALEQYARSVDYKTVTPKRPFVLVVGNEVDGIEKDTLEMADVVVEIPMHGRKESLNVSVSFGIALFRMLNI